MNLSLPPIIKPGLGLSTLIKEEIVVDYIHAIKELIAMLFTKKESLFQLIKLENKTSFSGVSSLSTT
jgi:hypothetical protein